MEVDCLERELTTGPFCCMGGVGSAVAGLWLEQCFASFPSARTACSALAGAAGLHGAFSGAECPCLSPPGPDPVAYLGTACSLPVSAQALLMPEAGAPLSVCSRWWGEPQFLLTFPPEEAQGSPRFFPHLVASRQLAAPRLLRGSG